MVKVVGFGFIIGDSLDTGGRRSSYVAVGCFTSGVSGAYRWIGGGSRRREASGQVSTVSGELSDDGEGSDEARQRSFVQQKEGSQVLSFAGQIVMNW